MIKKRIGTIVAALAGVTGVQAQTTANESNTESIGLIITVTLATITCLVILYLIFKYIGKAAIRLSRQRAMKSSGVSKEQAKGMSFESGEIIAAISMAIYEITEDEHDEENTVLTIKNVTRNYSPWNSKIYMLRELPKK